MLYAIGDIHGMIDKLQNVLSKIPLKKHDILIFLGDYIDRGPNSREVLDECFDLSKKYKTIFLKGNHEDLFIKCPHDNDAFECWIYNGGQATIDSYKSNDGMIPIRHIEFFKSLLPFYQTKHYYFCHAGINPNISLVNQSEEDLLWIRNEFLYSEKKFEKIIIHGHSVSKDPVIKENRIGIDTGSFLPNGKITCLDVINRNFYFGE